MRMMLSVSTSALFALSNGSKELAAMANSYSQDGNESAAGALEETSEKLRSLAL